MFVNPQHKIIYIDAITKEKKNIGSQLDGYQLDMFNIHVHILTTYLKPTF